jgi:hypothetical protein
VPRFSKPIGVFPKLCYDLKEFNKVVDALQELRNYIKMKYSLL